jgi:glycosyltransferase involved in cell wall biosynthesis
MNSPLISIIMNCYNSDRFLKEAIDSIYAQTYSNWEIIFWDNASTDQSALIAKSYDQRIRYFCSEETTPLGEARNLALQHVSGKYVAFLDCDDIYLPDKLDKQVRSMELNGSSLCYGGVIIINNDGSYRKTNEITEKSGFLLNNLLLRYEINMQTVMITASILSDKNLSFDSSLKFSPDYDLFMRIASNYKICSLSDCLAKYRKSDNSLTIKMIEYIAPEMEVTLNKINNSVNTYENISKNLNKAFLMLNFYRALPYIWSGNYIDARKLIIKTIPVRKKMFLLYLLLFFPVNKKWLIKLITG